MIEIFYNVEVEVTPSDKCSFIFPVSGVAQTENGTFLERYRLLEKTLLDKVQGMYPEDNINIVFNVFNPLPEVQES
jgi:hypothetical protein